MAETVIEGTVDAIVYSNPENGYTVLRVETSDGVVTISGNIPGATVGERLVMTGAWTTHPK